MMILGRPGCGHDRSARRGGLRVLWCWRYLNMYTHKHFHIFHVILGLKYVYILTGAGIVAGDKLCPGARQEGAHVRG